MADKFDPNAMAKIAQDAMRASGTAYRASLRGEVYQFRHESGLHKMVEYAKEMRAKAVHDMVNGTKEKFESYQATWRAWDDVVSAIEIAPVEVNQEKPKAPQPGE